MKYQWKEELFFLFFSCNIPPQNLNCVLLKITQHALFSKILTLQNFYNSILHDFQQLVFHTE